MKNHYKKRGAYWTPLEALAPLIAHEIGRRKGGLDWPNPIWEPACGNGAIATPLRELGHTVHTSDTTDYGCPKHFHHDFLASADKRPKDECVPRFKSIITNPPFTSIWAWLKHAVKDILPKPDKVAMLLPASSLGDCTKALPGSGMSLTRLLMFSESLTFRGADGEADVNWGTAWFVFSKGEGLTGEIVMV